MFFSPEVSSLYRVDAFSHDGLYGVVEFFCSEYEIEAGIFRAVASAHLSVDD